MRSGSRRLGVVVLLRHPEGDEHVGPYDGNLTGERVKEEHDIIELYPISGFSHATMLLLVMWGRRGVNTAAITMGWKSVVAFNYLEHLGVRVCITYNLA